MTATFALICALLAALPLTFVERVDRVGEPVAQVQDANVEPLAERERLGRLALREGAAVDVLLGRGPDQALGHPGRNELAGVLHGNSVVTLAGGTTYSGNLAWAAPSHGPRYLALREPLGTLVEACGPAGCVTRRSTDFGPVLSLWRAGRIADLSAADWQTVCGVPLRFGLCPGSIEVLSRRPATPLPATDTLEGP